MKVIDNHRFAQAAVFIYEQATLEDRYYHVYSLVTAAAELIWRYRDQGWGKDESYQTAFDALSWLEEIGLVNLWPAGNLTLVMGATSESMEPPGWTRVSCWWRARDSQEFVKLAKNWTELEEGEQ